MARRPQVRYFASRGAYYCQINGVQHKLAVGPDDGLTGPTYKAALAEYLRLISQGSIDTAGNENTVRTIFNGYMDAIAAKRKARTVKIKTDLLRIFVARYGDHRVSQIKAYHAELIVTEMRKPRPWNGKILRWGDATVRMFLMNVKAAFTWGIKKELTTRNPLSNIEMPSSRTRARERIITPAEHQSILDGLRGSRSGRLRNMVIALENTGARPGEVRNATVGDWHDDLQAIIYYADDKRREDEFAHKTSGKGKDRVIYFTGEAAALVRALAHGKSRTDLLFPNNKGQRYGDKMLAECFRGIRDRLNLPHLVPYAYRHTLATGWLKAGRSIEMLAEILGNTPQTIRLHYSHLCKEHSALRAEIEEFKLENLEKSGA